MPTTPHDIEHHLHRIAEGGHESVAERLGQLDEEWSAGQLTKAAAGALVVGGLVLARRHAVFALLPAAGAVALAQSASGRKSWLSSLFNQCGFRGRSEIEKERLALRTLRGDFRHLPSLHDLRPEPGRPQPVRGRGRPGQRRRRGQTGTPGGRPPGGPGDRRLSDGTPLAWRLSTRCHPPEAPAMPAALTPPQGTPAAPTAAGHVAPVAELLGGIVGDVQTLIKQQAQMLRAEIREDFNRGKSAAVYIGAGLGLAAVGVLFLVVGVVYLLNYLAPVAAAVRLLADRRRC